MKLENDDDQLMAIAAHRYCLGRSSYIVSACLDWLRATWSQLTPNGQHVMLRDTVEALVNGRAGCPTIDVPGWRKAALWMAQQMPADRLAGVRQSLAWKGEAVAEYLPI